MHLICLEWIPDIETEKDDQNDEDKKEKISGGNLTKLISRKS